MIYTIIWVGGEKTFCTIFKDRETELNCTKLVLNFKFFGRTIVLIPVCTGMRNFFAPIRSPLFETLLFPAFFLRRRRCPHSTAVVIGVDGIQLRKVLRTPNPKNGKQRETRER